MKLPIYIVDAFAQTSFSGNPAAICPLDKWIDDDVMQKIAEENNLSETAFFVPVGDKIEIRWFTPNAEVDLCGHATLATAYVVFNQLQFKGESIHFFSPRSGDLKVTKSGEQFFLNFPSDTISPLPMDEKFHTCFAYQPSYVYQGKTDLMFVFENEDQIHNIGPNFIEISKLRGRGVIVKAKGKEVDFVSRCFYPPVGVNEDPVTGSAHTTMIPYWSKTLNKVHLSAKQISKRGGHLTCEYQGERVVIGGEGKLYLVGTIEIA